MRSEYKTTPKKEDKRLSFENSSLSRWHERTQRGWHLLRWILSVRVCSQTEGKSKHEFILLALVVLSTLLDSREIPFLLTLACRESLFSLAILTQSNVIQGTVRRTLVVHVLLPLFGGKFFFLKETFKSIAPLCSASPRDTLDWTSSFELDRIRRHKIHEISVRSRSCFRERERLVFHELLNLRYLGIIYS